jgi:hypothetical protein
MHELNTRKDERIHGPWEKKKRVMVRMRVIHRHTLHIYTNTSTTLYSLNSVGKTQKGGMHLLIAAQNVPYLVRDEEGDEECPLARCDSKG